MKNIKNIAFAITITLFAVSCKKETTPEPKEIATAKTEIAAENLETASFTIEGMTCEVGCAKTIESKLAGTDGVSEAKVDFETKITEVGVLSVIRICIKLQNLKKVLIKLNYQNVL